MPYALKVLRVCKQSVVLLFQNCNITYFFLVGISYFLLQKLYNQFGVVSVG